MKAPTLLYALALCGFAPQIYSQASSVGPMPDERKAAPVTEQERNPFGKRVTKTATEIPSDGESEESRIRAHAGMVGISGYRTAVEGNKALLGSYLVTVGYEVPPFFPNQTEILRVNSITPTQVELGFVEKDGTHATRLINLAFDLSPAVRYKLAPAKSVEAAATSEFGGVIRKK